MNTERYKNKIQYHNDTHKNNVKPHPTHGNDFPDYISDVQSFEQLSEELTLAGKFVAESYNHPLVQPIMQELAEKLPHNAEHSYDMAIIAGILAIHFRLPETEQKLITRAGVLHDVGKLDVTGPDWEDVEWSPEALVKNLPLLPLHPPASAARAVGIDSQVVIPIELHHAFQKNNPYPDLHTYINEKGVEDLTVSRFLALADQTEAFITRHQRKGILVSDNDTYTMLTQHSYETIDGETVRSFSDEEISLAIRAYHLLNAEKSPKAA